jgi:hypothetical protein
LQHLGPSDQCYIDHIGGLSPGQVTILVQQSLGLLLPPNEELLNLLVTRAIAHGERELLFKCLSRGIRSASDFDPNHADSHPKRQRTIRPAVDLNIRRAVGL